MYRRYVISPVALATRANRFISFCQFERRSTTSPASERLARYEHQEPLNQALPRQTCYISAGRPGTKVEWYQPTS